MDEYSKDIGKFVFIEYTRDSGKVKVKGVLRTVRDTGEHIILRVENISNPSIAYMIPEISITSYFARPLKEV